DAEDRRAGVTVWEERGAGLEDEASEVDRLAGGAIGGGSGEDLRRDAGGELDDGEWSRCGLLRGQAVGRDAGKRDESEERENRDLQELASHYGSFLVCNVVVMTNAS